MTQVVESCANCLHCQRMHEICSKLVAMVWCRDCQKPFAIADAPLKTGPPNCPTCGDVGQDLALEDISKGRPEYCPGFEVRPNVNPAPVQRGLF